MQPCSRDMPAMNSLLNITQQIPPQDQLQINGNSNGHQQFQNPQFDPTSSHDDFLEQMLLSTLPASCSWSESDLKSPWDPPKSDETSPPNPDNNVGFHYNEILASKLRHHQMNPGGGSFPTTAAVKMMMEQEIKLPGMAAVDGGGRGEGSTMPLSLPSGGGEGSVQALYNGFGTGSPHLINIRSSNHQPQHFHHPQGGNMQAQNFGATAAGTVVNQSQASGSTTGGTPAQPKQRVRARRGQATDPHSIAERLRRERIAERMKALQELVPNANRTDKASMLDEIIDYVKFLQLQVKVLSVSRLGGAGAAVAPLVTERGGGGGGGDCIQTSANGGPGSYGEQTSSTNDGLTVTEHQVVKLMEEDMGSAMQYLQGKGLCLMPISLATAISTSTCHSRNPPTINNPNPNNGGSSSNNNNNNHHPLLQSSGEGPSSPSMSVLTVQSATMGTGVVDGSVSKP